MSRSSKFFVFFPIVYIVLMYDIFTEVRILFYRNFYRGIRCAYHKVQFINRAISFAWSSFILDTVHNLVAVVTNIPKFTYDFLLIVE